MWIIGIWGVSVLPALAQGPQGSLWWPQVGLIHLVQSYQQKSRGESEHQSLCWKPDPDTWYHVLVHCLLLSSSLCDLVIAADLSSCRCWRDRTEQSFKCLAQCLARQRPSPCLGQQIKDMFPVYPNLFSRFSQEFDWHCSPAIQEWGRWLSNVFCDQYALRTPGFLSSAPILNRPECVCAYFWVGRPV